MQSTGLRILIEEKPGVWEPQPEAGAKMHLTVTERTSIYIRQEGSSWRRGGQEDVKTGASASAWAAGAVFDTYPQQGQAGEIAITPAAETRT